MKKSNIPIWPNPMKPHVASRDWVVEKALRENDVDAVAVMGYEREEEADVGVGVERKSLLAGRRNAVALIFLDKVVK